MSVLIPWTRIASVALRPMLFSGEQEGSLGGIDLHVPRMGDRFAADVATTQFRQDAESRLFVAALFEASTDDARIALYQPAVRQQMAAQPVVDGADQSGSTLRIRGLFRGSPLLRGQFFNIVHGGVHFLYMIRQQIVADANGSAAVPIWPMLRFLTIDGEPCVFDQPVIEGRLSGFDKGAQFTRSRVDPLQFAIAERA